MAENHIKLTLVTKWEQNRCEQNDRRLQQREDDFVQSICEHSVQKDREQIAIAEIESKLATQTGGICVLQINL